MSLELNLDKLFKAVDYDVADSIRESVGLDINLNMRSIAPKVWWHACYGVNEPVRNAMPTTVVSTKTSSYEFTKKYEHIVN